MMWHLTVLIRRMRYAAFKAIMSIEPLLCIPPRYGLRRAAGLFVKTLSNLLKQLLKACVK
jgi:hypothetical protein